MANVTRDLTKLLFKDLERLRRRSFLYYVFGGWPLCAEYQDLSGPGPDQGSRPLWKPPLSILSDCPSSIKKFCLKKPYCIESFFPNICILFTGSVIISIINNKKEFSDETICKVINDHSGIDAQYI